MLNVVRTKTLAAAAALLAALALTTCASLSAVIKEPAVSLRSVELVKISFSGVDMLCKVDVKNPNPIDIPFPEIGWELFVNTNSFVTGVVKNGNPLRKLQSTVVEVPVSLSYLELFNSIQSLTGSEQADYKIALAAKFSLPVLGDRVWNFEHEGVFPVLQLPKLSFKGISVKNFNPLNPLRIDLELSWEVENKNSFALNIKDMNFNFAVNNSNLTSGRVSGVQIAAKGETIVPTTVTIDSLNTVATIATIITQGRDISYSCSGSLSLGAALPGVADYTTPFNFTGTTRINR